MHHGVQDQWLLMQGNEVQNECARKAVAETLANHAFHVINVTLFGSRGTSSANSFSSGSSKISSRRFARFRDDSNLGSCINFQRKPRRTNSFQGAHAASGVFRYNIS